MTAQDIAGIVAASLIFLSQGYEIRSIFIPDPLSGERTRPSRSTFWIWTLVQAMMAGSYIATGERYAAGVSIGYTVTMFVIAVLSIPYGYSRWTRIDSYCLAAAVLTAIFWVAFRDPAIVLLAAVSTDFIGSIPTIKKVWIHPTSESRIAWALTIPACIINFWAVTEWTFEDYVYIPYLLIVNSVITYGIWRTYRPPSRITG